MPEISVTGAINAPANKAWALVGAFDYMPKYLDAVVSSSLIAGGRARRLTLEDGCVVDEPLLYFDDRERVLMWTVGEHNCDFPFTSFIGRFSVRESTRESCIFEIWGRYEPAKGREQESNDLIQGYFDDCIKGVRGFFSA